MTKLENESKKDAQDEALIAKYPVKLSAQVLVQKTTESGFNGSFKAFIPGTGPTRGLVTLTNSGTSDGQLKIVTGTRSFAVIADPRKHDVAVFIDEETAQAIGITPELREQKRVTLEEHLGPELRLVQA